MHSSPHPNQIRSACERCRRQKLRCLRQPDDAPSCARCTRLGFQCESGSQRKVGRPAKKEALRRSAQSPKEATATAGLEVVVSNSHAKPFPRVDDYATGFISVDWSLPVGSPVANSPGGGATPVESWFIPRGLTPPDSDSESTEVRCSDGLFQSLSKLHVEIRGLSDIWTGHAMHMSFDTFYCVPHDSFKPIAATRAMLATAQDFLRILRALHRRVGTLPITLKVPPQQPHGVRSGWTWTSMLTYLDESDAANGQQGASRQVASTRILDSSTAFLVISCFVMLVKCIENLFTMTHARLNDLSDGPIRTDLAFSEMMFIDVPIIELSTQGVLFAEGLLHLLSQINVVLGFPSRWSGRSTWTGLLSAPKYRDLLNKELGYVEGLWSTRPFRLNETIIMTKDLLQELAMMGYA